MNTLYLLRHSLTQANEQRLYCGRTDLSLSSSGRALAMQMRQERMLPECSIYITSGMRRATETLALLTGHTVALTVPSLAEMDFGVYEMHSYEQLCRQEDYLHWIEDVSGNVACPQGESRNAFLRRVMSGGSFLLTLSADSALAVCHGGVIANLMQAWFPVVQKNFYEWQPAACRGYCIEIESGTPCHFQAI